MTFFKDLCQKKDKEYQDLVYVQDQGIEFNKQLRDERDTAKTELTQLKDELAARDRYIDNLQSQLESKDQILGTLTADNQRLQDEASKCTPAQSPGNLKQLIKSWRKQSKQTRDWTKANQLLAELEKLIE